MSAPAIPADVFADAGRLDQHQRETLDHAMALVWPIVWLAFCVGATVMALVLSVLPEAAARFVQHPLVGWGTLAGFALTLYRTSRRGRTHERLAVAFADRGYHVARQGHRRWLIDARAGIAVTMPDA